MTASMLSHTLVSGVFDVVGGASRIGYRRARRSPFPGYDFEITLAHGYGKRYARITKTRAYVVVDEVEGKPVVEKWEIRKHAQFFD